MAATIVQSVFGSGNAVQTYNVTIASATAGNLLIAVGTENNVTLFGPSGGPAGVMIAGWNKDAYIAGANDGIQVASKAATGGETSVAIQHTGPADSQVWILEVSGVSTTKDFAATFTGSCSGSPTTDTPVTSGTFSAQDDFCVYGVTGSAAAGQNPWASATVNQGFVDPTTGTSTETMHTRTGGGGDNNLLVVASGVKTGPTSFTVQFTGGNNNWFADVARALVGYGVTGTAVLPPIVAPSPIPPEFILAQYGIDPWMTVKTPTALAAVTNASAEVASGTGSAANATPAEGLPAGASGTGSAFNATTTQTSAAGLASGTGTALAVTSKESVPAGLSSGTGAAGAVIPAFRVPAGLASGTGTAFQASAVTGTIANAQNVAGTGTAQTPTVISSTAAGVASGIGSASNATATKAVNPAAENAAGTGTAQIPTTKELVPIALASGTGVANNATVSTASATNAPAGLAFGTGSVLTLSTTIRVKPIGSGGPLGYLLTEGISAPAATNAAATIATGTGAALTATTKDTVNAGQAAGTGTAYDASTTVPSGNWQPLKIGAGGYITGIDISADGTGKYIRTDTYGGYRLVGSTWKQLVTSVSMPAADRLPNSGIGVYEVACAPGTSSRVYMAWGNSVYRSNDSGDTWTVTALTGKTFDPNDNSYYRICGRKMIVDPANADVVYFGAPNDGLWGTTNGGTSWTAVSSAQVPVATFTDVRGNHPGYLGMAFDPSGGTTSGRTNNIYVWSAGHGLYRSTNQGSTWTNITGGPDLSTKFIECAAVDPTNGVYYCVVSDAINVNPVVWRYTPSGNTWFQSTSVVDYVPHGITIDPNNHLHIVFQRMFGGGLAQSNDGGTTWDYSTIYNSSTTWTATDVPWLGLTGIQGSGGDIRFDPVVANKMWNVEGIAPWTATVTYGLGTIAYTSVAAGIEQLVVNKIIAPAGGDPLVATWDRGTFYLTNLSTYPSTYKPSTAFDATWDIDYAGGTPSFIVASHSDNQGNSLLAGYSTNFGSTWTTYPAMPLGATGPYTYGFGNMAVSTDTQHIVWLGAPNQWPYYTTNRGTSWTACTISGLSNPGDVNAAFIWAVFLNRHQTTADKVTSNAFYIYASYPTDATKRGFYKSTDGGANFSRVGPSAPVTADISSQSVGEAVYWATFNAQLESVPSHAGHLFFTPGAVGSNPDSATADGYAFLHSTDGGATWSTIANVKEVYCFGFGKPSGAGYPSIYIIGWVSTVFGVWRSDDEGGSWTNIGTFPLNSLDFTTTIAGDMDIYGRCYVGFRGSGAAYRDL